MYMNQIAPQNKVNFAMKRLKKIQSFCEIIAVDGRPFAWLLGTGFMHSQEDDLNELASAGFGISLDKNFTELKSYIKKIATEIREKIKNELKGRFVSLMLDIATKNHKSVFGISIQFVQNDEIEIRTLGLIVLHKSHTAKYIVDMLLKCLEQFGIEIDHVITITTDNAANMLAMIDQFDEHVQISTCVVNNHSLGESEIPTFDHDGPLSDAQIEQVLNTMRDIEALDSILDDTENFDDLFREVIGDLSQTARFVTTIRCGAHTVQLIVRDALKKSGFKGLLALCQHVAKKLRLDSYKQSANEANITYKFPRLSCQTRWDSDYSLVRNLYLL